MSTDEIAVPRRASTVITLIAWAAFGLAVASNIWGLYAPSQPGPPMFPGFDKVAHFGSFALLTLTGLLAGIRPRVLVIVLVAHAAISELVQATVLPGRSGDITDLLADSAGVAIGWLVWRTILRGRSVA